MCYFLIILMSAPKLSGRLDLSRQLDLNRRFTFFLLCAHVLCHPLVIYWGLLCICSRIGNRLSYWCIIIEACVCIKLSIMSWFYLCLCFVRFLFWETKLCVIVLAGVEYKNIDDIGIFMLCWPKGTNTSVHSPIISFFVFIDNITFVIFFVNLV